MHEKTPLNRTGFSYILELKLIAEAYPVAIRFNIVLVVTHLLVSVEQTKGVLLGDSPVETDMKTRLLQTPGIEELDIGVGSHGEAFH